MRVICGSRVDEAWRGIRVLSGSQAVDRTVNKKVFWNIGDTFIPGFYFKTNSSYWYLDLAANSLKYRPDRIEAASVGVTS